jgi:hypothetical protein
MEWAKRLTLCSMEARRHAKVTGAGLKSSLCSLSRKPASLLGKFPISEPGRDTSEEN